MREQSLRQKEMFVPLVHPPGDAQVDFGEADIIRCGRVERAHFFVMDLPHSDDAFVMAFPAETTEAFLEGHNQAFAYFGGVAEEHRLRQHQDCRGQDPGRRHAAANTGFR